MSHDRRHWAWMMHKPITSEDQPWLSGFSLRYEWLQARNCLGLGLNNMARTLIDRIIRVLPQSQPHGENITTEVFKAKDRLFDLPRLTPYEETAKLGWKEDRLRMQSIGFMSFAGFVSFDA